MTEPLVQVGLPLRETDPAYVILRLNDFNDVEAARGILNEVAQLAPLMVGAKDAVEEARLGDLPRAMGALQAGGLNPQVIPQTQAHPAQAIYANQPEPMPAPQPQGQVQHAQADPPGDCWAANTRKMHQSGCPDCGAPTILKGVGISGGRTVNAHVCTNDPSHKRKWCETPAWNTKAVKYRGQGGHIDPSVVTG